MVANDLVRTLLVACGLCVSLSCFADTGGPPTEKCSPKGFVKKECFREELDKRLSPLRIKFPGMTDLQLSNLLSKQSESCEDNVVRDGFEGELLWVGQYQCQWEAAKVLLANSDSLKIPDTQWQEKKLANTVLPVLAEKSGTLSSGPIPVALKAYIVDKFEADDEDANVINLGDINSDTLDDFLITIRNSAYCGTAGCTTQLLLSDSGNRFRVGYDGNLFELALHKVDSRGVAVFNAAGHFSMCAESGPGVCKLLLELNSDKLVILEKVLQP